MRKLTFNSQAQEHLQDLFISEDKLIKKVFNLIADIQKHPF